MPELPEVETVKNILEPAIKNKTIDYIDVFYDRLVQSDLITFKNELKNRTCLLYTSPSPRDGLLSRMPSSA